MIILIPGLHQPCGTRERAGRFIETFILGRVGSTGHRSIIISNIATAVPFIEFYNLITINDIVTACGTIRKTARVRRTKFCINGRCVPSPRPRIVNFTCHVTIIICRTCLRTATHSRHIFTLRQIQITIIYTAAAGGTVRIQCRASMNLIINR